jgi:hypothetical protein
MNTAFSMDLALLPSIDFGDLLGDSDPMLDSFLMDTSFTALHTADTMAADLHDASLGECACMRRNAPHCAACALFGTHVLGLSPAC